MKKLILIIIAAVCSFSSVQAQSFQLAKIGGSPSTDYGYGMCLDNAGNMYVAGCYKSNAAFDNVNVTSLGDFDIFIAKYNAAGALLWFKSAGSSAKDEADRIFLGPDGNIYVAGTFQSFCHWDNISIHAQGSEAGEDIFLAKLDTDGNYLWVKSYGGLSQDFISDMDVNNNSIFMSGYYYGTFLAPGGISLPPGTPSTGKFVMKLDLEGVPVWAKNTGGNTWISVSDNDYYIAGLISGTVNFDGTELTSNGPTDLFLARYDLNGNKVWLKQFGGSGSENMRSVKYDKTTGSIYWAGSFQNTMIMGTNTLTSAGQHDIFISKFDLSGNNLWAKSVPGSGFDIANATATDNSGNVYVSGYFTETANFGGINVTSMGSGDLYIVKYNSNGDFQWVRTGGGAGQDNGMYLRTDNNSNIYLTGFFSGGAAFGSLSLAGYGSADFILLKISTTTDITYHNSLVRSFSLYQNYPNPFNPQTNIKFDLPESGFVSLKVYDMKGKEVSILAGQNMRSGSYSVNFNAAGLSSGIYFYKLSSGSFTETKKMILVK
ncbi:Ig-like domain-containing protein [soil metagenome]